MSNINVEEIMKQIKEGIQGAKTTKELNDVLDKIHPSDAYVAIRDMFIIATNRMINASKNSADTNEIAEYQRFQDIKLAARRSWDHDHTNATMLDVDKAVSKSYGITLRMIKATNDIADERFGRVFGAINKIEKHLGLEVTNFKEVANNDTTKPSDVQGIEENTAGTGDSGTEL
jgi:hypothetical protein